MNDTFESALSDPQFTSYIYTDKGDREILDQLSQDLGSVNFIVRNEEQWSIRYITGLIMDPNVSTIVIHEINALSIAEITLATFMCKTILCTNNSIKEYPKLHDMITDIQPGCNLNINNNSFKHWYESMVRK